MIQKFRAKFRVWDNEKKEYCEYGFDKNGNEGRFYLNRYGDLGLRNRDGKVITFNYHRYGDPEFSIGRQDKNSTEIYAGDICFLNDEENNIKITARIAWEEENARFVAYSDCVFPNPIAIHALDEFEIIGNIHEEASK